MEDTSAGNIAKWKKLADYAHQQRHSNWQLFALFSSRKISDEDDVIDPVTGKPDKGLSLAMRLAWGANGDWLILIS